MTLSPTPKTRGIGLSPESHGSYHFYLIMNAKSILLFLHLSILTIYKTNVYIIFYEILANPNYLEDGQMQTFFV